MGRIKTVLIKRTTNEIMAKYGEKFTTDFTKNRQVLDGLVQVDSKKLRNIIAGYATRLVQMRQRHPAPRRRQQFDERGEIADDN